MKHIVERMDTYFAPFYAIVALSIDRTGLQHDRKYKPENLRCALRDLCGSNPGVSLALLPRKKFYTPQQQIQVITQI